MIYFGQDGCPYCKLLMQTTFAEIIEQVTRPGCRFLVASAGVLEKLPKAVKGVECVVLAGPARDGLAERVQVHDHEIDRLDAVLGEL